MDVDVDLACRNLQEQRQHRVAITCEHVGVGTAHCANEQAVLHRAAVDEQVLVVSHATIVGRQSGDAGEVVIAAEEIDLDRIAGKFASYELGDASFEGLTGLYVKRATAIVLEREAKVRSRHGETTDNVRRGGPFGTRAAQELAPRGYLLEQLFDPDAGAGGKSGRPFCNHHAIVDHSLPAIGDALRAGFDRDTGDRRDGRQRLSPESQRFDHLDRFIGKLRSGVAFEGEFNLVWPHAAAVVRYLDHGEATFGQAHMDMACACIDGVFDEFLERACRTLDDLSGGDAVDQGFGEAADDSHGPNEPSAEADLFRDKR